jgi:hypothetical protein
MEQAPFLTHRLLLNDSAASPLTLPGPSRSPANNGTRPTEKKKVRHGQTMSTAHMQENTPPTPPSAEKPPSSSGAPYNHLHTRAPETAHHPDNRPPPCSFSPPNKPTSTFPCIPLPSSSLHVGHAPADSNLTMTGLHGPARHLSPLFFGQTWPGRHPSAGRAPFYLGRLRPSTRPPPSGACALNRASYAALLVLRACCSRAPGLLRHRHRHRGPSGYGVTRRRRGMPAERSGAGADMLGRGHGVAAKRGGRSFGPPPPPGRRCAGRQKAGVGRWGSFWFLVGPRSVPPFSLVLFLSRSPETGTQHRRQ